jgi:Tol biopolymer transport system component
MNKKRFARVAGRYAGALVLATAFGCGGQSGSSGPSSPQLTGLIISSDSTLETSPANLYVVRPDGTGTCYVTNDDNLNREAGWSYDGTKIVYFTGNIQGGIWTMDANGDNKRQLPFSSGSRAFAPAFSPDGRSIVYSDDGVGELKQGLVGYEVWVMNVDGSNKQQLTKTTVAGTTRTGIAIRWAIRPMYSPDGTKIAYASTQSGRTQIWVMNADGTNQTELTFNTISTAPDANFPSYSPDGQKIAFLGGYETEYGNIWLMNADGSNRTQLTHEPDPVSSDEPAWSGDGQSIMFDSNRVDPALGRQAAETWVMDADGSNPRVLLPHMYGEGRNPWRKDPVQPGAPTFQCKN